MRGLWFKVSLSSRDGKKLKAKMLHDIWMTNQKTEQRVRFDKQTYLTEHSSESQKLRSMRYWWMDPWFCTEADVVHCEECCHVWRNVHKENMTSAPPSPKESFWMIVMGWKQSPSEYRKYFSPSGITDRRCRHSPPCCAWWVCCPQSRNCPIWSRKGVPPWGELTGREGRQIFQQRSRYEL